MLLDMSFPIPGYKRINSFTLAAQKVNPNIKQNCLGFYLYDPGKELKQLKH